MVLEKLKEREDAKDQREDKQILATIDGEINEKLEKVDILNMELEELYNQYYKISWEQHEYDYRDPEELDDL